MLTPRWSKTELVNHACDYQNLAVVAMDTATLENATSEMYKIQRYVRKYVGESVNWYIVPISKYFS